MTRGRAKEQESGLPAVFIDTVPFLCYYYCICIVSRPPGGERQQFQRIQERSIMERIHTIETRDLCESAKNGGCGECQTSCQSACKTSCGVANQKCENAEQ